MRSRRTAHALATGLLVFVCLLLLDRFEFFQHSPLRAGGVALACSLLVSTIMRMRYGPAWDRK